MLYGVSQSQKTNTMPSHLQEIHKAATCWVGETRNHSSGEVEAGGFVSLRIA